MPGRGAWNNAGLGGTKAYKSANPGPYYYKGTGYDQGTRDANEYAVWGAVKAYQKALTEWGFPCTVDGLYGDQTVRQVTAWQTAWVKTGDPKASIWGGIGPESSEHMLKKVLDRVYAAFPDGDVLITKKIVSGVIRMESNWDAGAVGYVDNTDVGLAQINAGANPDWSTDQRLTPELSFNFVLSYLNVALDRLGLNIRDAIASYNLGVGGRNSSGVLVGCKAWIAAGRPDIWTPPYTTTPRAVKVYIDKILAG